jgi:alpha-tubulin suppressor-like RCC1 family protein
MFSVLKSLSSYSGPVRSKIVGNNHGSKFLIKNGEVYAFGYGKKGNLGIGDFQNHPAPVKINFFEDIGPIKEVSAGYSGTFFLTETGDVYSCGEGRLGNLGTGNTDDQSIPTKIDFPAGAAPIKKISTTDGHTAFLSEAGEVFTCGYGLWGGLGTGDKLSRFSPVKIDFPFGTGPIKGVSVKGYRSMFLAKTGEVYACGRGFYGQLGIGRTRESLVPTKVIFPPNIDRSQASPIKKIILALDYTMFLSETGEVYACGRGHGGAMGTGDENDYVTPVKVAFFDEVDPVKKIIVDHNISTVFLTEAGDVYTCGKHDPGMNDLRYLLSSFSTPKKLIPNSGPIKEISLGLFLAESGKVLTSVGTSVERERDMSPLEVVFPPGTGPIKEMSNYVFMTESEDFYIYNGEIPKIEPLGIWPHDLKATKINFDLSGE